MPPKKDAGKARSTKTVDSKGNATVKSVARGANATARTLAEVSIEFEPAAVGVKCNNQEITNITAGSQAEKKGVQTGWLIFDVAGKGVKTTKDVTNALGAARKAGKNFVVKFKTPSTEADAATPAPAEASSAPPAPAGAAAEPAAAAAAAEDAAAVQAKILAEAERLAQEEAAKAAAEAEALRLKELGNGEVTLIYEQYDEKFPIVDGSITAEAIDEEYCLSFVMPNCTIALLTVEPKKLHDDDLAVNPYVAEEPEGTFQGMLKDTTYWVLPIQDARQLRLDQETNKLRFAAAKKEVAAQDAKYKEMGLAETCSCIYGNPCMDEYGCKDWSNRFAVATANGWKGF